jgi:hypothetical protein
MTKWRYRRWFIGLVIAAGVWRVLYVLVFKVGDGVVGDQIYYSGQAVTIANGNWFADPFPPGGYAADHAPLTALAVAPASWSDNDALMPQRLLMALYGTAVVAGIGVTTRWLTDRRTSLVATVIAALYANLWMNDGLVMAETPAALAVVALLFAAYRFDLRRTRLDAVLMGVAVGFAGLARAELLLLGPLLVAPLVMTRTMSVDRRRRLLEQLGHLALAGLAALAVVSPWIVRNQIRFDESVTMSTQDGLTLVGTNCPAAFEGSGRGFWSLQCALDIDVPRGVDQSVRSGIYRDAAFEYLGENSDQLPAVIAARLGRGLSLWQNDGMIALNQAEGRERGASTIGIWQFWALVPLAAWGLLRWPLSQSRWPMLALMIMSLLTIAAFYGIPRFRVAAEVAIVICAAIGGMELWNRWAARSTTSPRVVDA